MIFYISIVLIIHLNAVHSIYYEENNTNSTNKITKAVFNHQCENFFTSNRKHHKYTSFLFSCKQKINTSDLTTCHVCSNDKFCCPKSYCCEEKIKPRKWPGPSLLTLLVSFILISSFFIFSVSIKKCLKLRSSANTVVVAYTTSSRTITASSDIMNQVNQ